MGLRTVLAIDHEAVAKEIQDAIRFQVLGTFRRRGAVVGLSGGVDSSVVATLCARALGPDRVLGLMMPERDSSPESLDLGSRLADHLGIQTIVEEITAALEAIGCYSRQLDAIQTIFPEYGPGYRCKLTLPSILDRDRMNITSLTIRTPSGDEKSARLPAAAYLQLVGATNFKQRIRKSIEFYHADRMNYAVAGTPNRLEYDQGFFVKQGDGYADFKPIAHLYKTQVYALAEYIGVPPEIRMRPPTTDTFSLPQTQEEFYFSLPYHLMDLCLYAHDHAIPASDAATDLGLTAPQVERVYRDIEAKRRATRYLHQPPLLVRPVEEIGRCAESPAS